MYKEISKVITMRIIKSSFLFRINDCKKKTLDKLVFKIGYKRDIEKLPLVISLKESSYTYQIIQDFQREVEFYNSLGPE